MKKERCVIKMIKVEDIRVVSSRSRESKKYAEIVDSILKLGLKTPIVVAPRISDTGERYYDLVCGEGRLNVFKERKAEYIPAHIIDASNEDLLIMGLVENFARKGYNKIGVIQEVQRLLSEGYSQAQIATKLNFSSNHISNICKLLKSGKEKLLEAVLRGKMKMTTAIAIADCTNDEDAQKELSEAYDRKEISMANIRFINNLLRNGDKIKVKNIRNKKNGASFVEAMKKEIKNGCKFIKKAEISERNLAYLKGAFNKILTDECFLNLLLSQKIGTIPEILTKNTNNE